MKQNIGNTDRIIRFVIGIVIIALGFVYQSWWGLIGLVLLVTATIKFCPPYALLGISTCATKESTTE
jgi:type IV secretory pathway TrbD component